MVFLSVIGVVVLIVLNSVISGFILSTLWGWFAVPALHAPPLSTVSAIGISILVGWFLRGIKHEEQFGEYKGFAKIAVIFVYDVAVAILTLFIAAIVKSFM